MASNKKRKSDIQDENAQEPAKKQKRAVAKSEQHPLILIFAMLISLFDMTKEPSCTSSDSRPKQRVVASKSNEGDFPFLSDSCPSHTQTQRIMRMRT